eukprot:GSChrysophyteH1.ASY1.ANO1.884.1 assembled CDS
MLSGKSQGQSGSLGKRGRDEPPYLAPPHRDAPHHRGPNDGPPVGSRLYGSGAPPPNSQYGPPGAGSSRDVEVILMVPNRVTGGLIGRGGDNLALLQRETGAKLQIQSQKEMAPGSDNRKVTITGSEANVSVLKEKIESYVREKTNNAAVIAQQDKKFVETMQVPDNRVGTIIGKGGSKMREIMETTRTVIKIPTMHDPDNSEVRTISISADDENDILACKAEILMLLESTTPSSSTGASASSSGQSQAGNSVSIVVPDDKVGSIIGKGGSVVKDLQSRFGVRLQIPGTADAHTNPPVRTITITGPPHSVQAAKAEIHEKVNYNPQAQYQQQYQHQPYGDNTNIYGGGANESVAEDTTYYADFWNYAATYGEKLAREYYKTWSPPVGTQPPPGVVVAPDMTAEQVAALTAASSESASKQAGESANASRETDEGKEGTKAEEWDAYVKGYRDWWLAHGKAAGAPEEPPKS